MQAGEDTSYYLTILMYVAPTVAMYLAGAIIACLFLTRYPRPAWFALLGCGLLILSSGSPILSYYLTTAGLGIGLHPETICGVINIIGIVMHIVGLGLIFAAVFLDRRPRFELAAAAEDRA